MNHPFFSLGSRTIQSLTLAGCALLILSCSSSHFYRIEPTSSKWENAIQEFEASDRSAPFPRNGVLFIGSSSIRMWKTLPTDFPEVATINRGFGGSQIVDSIYFASRIVHPYAPKKIFLYAGDNDIAKGKSAKIVLRDFKRFVKVVHDKQPETEIHFIAIKPSISRWQLADEMAHANKLVKAYSERHPKLNYVDIWTPMLNDSGKPGAHLFLDDGLHLNRSGYEIWVKAVAPFL